MYNSIPLFPLLLIDRHPWSLSCRSGSPNLHNQALVYQLFCRRVPLSVNRSKSSQSLWSTYSRTQRIGRMPHPLAIGWYRCRIQTSYHKHSTVIFTVLLNSSSPFVQRWHEVFAASNCHIDKEKRFNLLPPHPAFVSPLRGDPQGSSHPWASDHPWGSASYWGNTTLYPPLNRLMTLKQAMQFCRLILTFMFWISNLIDISNHRNIRWYIRSPSSEIRNISFNPHHHPQSNSHLHLQPLLHKISPGSLPSRPPGWKFMLENWLTHPAYQISASPSEENATVVW